jgi:hypothetical protein
MRRAFSADRRLARHARSYRVICFGLHASDEEGSIAASKGKSIMKKFFGPIVAVACLATGCTVPNDAKTPAPLSPGWQFAGTDDNTDNYPTQKFCSQSGDFDVMSNDAQGAQLCIDYVPGLKRYVLPEVTYYGQPEKSELTLKGDKSSIVLKLQRKGLAQQGNAPLWKVFVYEPSAKDVAKFLAGQKEVELNGAKINVAGQPWLK